MPPPTTKRSYIRCLPGQVAVIEVGHIVILDPRCRAADPVTGFRTV
jgi:hypothetical protein